MAPAGPEPTDRTPFTLLLVRHVIPAVVVVGGLVWYAIDPSLLAAEGAAGVVGAGLAWWLFGWLYRRGVEGEVERDDEEAARVFLDDRGRWPTDDESAFYARTGRWP